jgi:DNA/RNA-binding domain of Phe-tRNA-synthetase-like protein
MIFSIEDRLFEAFPGLTLGLLIAKIDNTRYGEDILEPVLARTRKALSADQIEAHPNVKAWREAFAKIGMSGGPYQSSIESLLLRALGGGVFPRVNPLVDLCTAISLDSLVPVGAHDIHPLDGNVALAFAKGDEPFTPMEGGEDEVAAPGEVVYKDDRSVLTRGWIWRQSNKDRVTAATTSVLIPVDVIEDLPSSLAGEVIGQVIGYLEKNHAGQVIFTDILTKQKTFTEFTV